MWPAIIGGVGSLLGGALGFWGQERSNSANAANANETNKFNAEQARLAREHSERMSSTAWQRSMSDMRSAGLNPMLAFSQGSAATPASQSATGVQAKNKNSLGDLGRGLSGASPAVLQALQSAAQIENLQSSSSAMGARRDLDVASIQTERAKARMHNSNAALNTLEGQLVNLKSKLLSYQLPSAKVRSEYDEKLAPADSLLDRLLKVFSGYRDGAAGGRDSRASEMDGITIRNRKKR